MFYNSIDFQEKYYRFVLNCFKLDKTLKIVHIDFENPLYKPIWSQKLPFIVDLFSETIQSVFESLTPLLIGYIIYNRNLSLLLAFGFVYLFLEIFNRLMLRIRSVYLLQCECSINYAAYRFFLTVDPLHHSSRSSGQIVSKIERGSRSYGDLINVILYNTIPILASFATIIAALTAYDYKLGIIALFTFLCLAVINSFLSFINAKSLVKRNIIAQDQKTEASIENLQQNALIRSSFATDIQNRKTADLTTKLMQERAVAWSGGGLATTVNRILFLGATIGLSVIILNLVDLNQMTAVTGVALLVTFLSAAGNVNRIGNTIRDITEKLTDITDLYKFIRSFGKKTFPVLEKDE